LVAVGDRLGTVGIMEDPSRRSDLQSAPALAWLHRSDFPRSIELLSLVLGQRRDLIEAGYWVTRQESIGIDWAGCAAGLSSTQAAVVLMVRAMHQWEWGGGPGGELRVAVRDYVEALAL
jgi:hypothetical protein